MRIMMLLAGFLMVAAPGFAQENTSATTLEISAQQEVKAEPDIATISAGVVTSAKTAAAAMKDNALKMNALFGAMKKAGITPKDQQTSGLTVNPQYLYQENKAPQITGYQASNTVQIILRDLKTIGPVLDALLAQGANQISGPSFSVADPDDLLDKARRDAIAKARKRAELYSDATGMKIKRLRSISENTTIGTPPAVPMMMMRKSMAAAEPTPVASGEVTLSVTVNIVYELQ